MKSLSGEVSALGAQSDAVAAEVAAGKVGMSHDAASSIWDEALRPLVAEYETWQERECERLIATMVAKHHEIAKQFEQHKNGVISGWKKRLLWTGVLGMVIITGTLAVYYRFGMTSEQQSLSEVIVWGAAGNAVWAFAVFLFERISASRTEWVATSRSVFFRSAAPTITREMLLWALTPPPDLSDLREMCQARLIEKVEALVSLSERKLRAEFQTIADEVELARKKGLGIVNEYRSAWESARRIIEGLYLETDEKIGRFKSVSAAFKERTIDRTRALFGERAEEFAKQISRLESSADDLRMAP
jgi:hypothetical protein